MLRYSTCQGISGKSKFRIFRSRIQKIFTQQDLNRFENSKCVHDSNLKTFDSKVFYTFIRIHRLQKLLIWTYRSKVMDFTSLSVFLQFYFNLNQFWPGVDWVLTRRWCGETGLVRVDRSLTKKLTGLRPHGAILFVGTPSPKWSNLIP